MPSRSDTYGPFRLVRPLGEGAMGSVFLAEHVTFGTEVALKVPPSWVPLLDLVGGA